MPSPPSDDRDAEDSVTSDADDSGVNDAEDSVASDADGTGAVDADARTPSGRRDVVVPMRVYKTVTVFSTLLAVLGVVVGFVLLDAATIRLSLLRRVVVGALGVVGLSPPAAVLSAALAVLGIAAIAFGAGVYVLGTRFRARGMGNAQEAAAESSDDG